MILVVIDSPRTATYGGVVAAPVFRAVAEYGLAATERRPAGWRPTRRPRRAGAPGAARGDAVGPTPRPLLQPVSTTAPETSPSGGLPSFLGLGMREALVRAQAEGWEVRVEGSGYVVQQDPPPGAVAADRTRHPALWLRRVLTL